MIDGENTENSKWKRAIALIDSGDESSAFRHLAEALKNAQDRDDIEAQKSVTLWLGRIHRRFGDLERARTAFESVLEMSARTDDQFAVAETLTDLAKVELRASELDLAIDACRRSIAIWDKSRNVLGIAEARLPLAEALNRRGELARAEIHATQAHAIATERQANELLIRAKLRLGRIALDRAQPGRALQFFVNAANLATSARRPAFSALAQCRACEVYIERAEYDSAADSLQRAELALGSQVHNPFLAALYERMNAELALRQGLDNAGAGIERALVSSSLLVDSELLGHAERLRGDWLRDKMDDALCREATRNARFFRAQKAFEASVKAFRKAGHEKEAAESQRQLGMLLLDHGDKIEAQRHLWNAHSTMKRVGHPKHTHIERVLQNIGR